MLGSARAAFGGNALGKLLGLLALLVLVQPAWAQDVAGQWQGTLRADKDLRIVLKISKAADGSLAGTFYSIDQGADGFPISAASLQNSIFALAVPEIRGSYKGTIDADSKHIKGAWTQGVSLPLDLAFAVGKTAWAIPSSTDTSPHKVQFVTTDDHVKLEVLDWGGAGRPLVFLAGLGGTAHVFDTFAPQFTGKYHVYGITRRGYGKSDKPEPTVANYSADRLGDDVLAVIDALKLDKPVLVGHSIAGEELSSIGTRHPEKVAGLIYLDAGYAYGFYAPGNLIPLGSNLTIDINEMNRKVMEMNAVDAPRKGADTLNDVIRTDLPQFKVDLLATEQQLREQAKVSTAASPPPDSPQMRIADAVMSGEEKYIGIKPPILAIFAVPKAVSPKAPAPVRSLMQSQNKYAEAQAKRFQAGNPSAHVVLIGNSQHDVFNSNTAEVVRDMNAFLDHLE